MASEIKESESPPSQSLRADPQQSQSAAKLNKVFIFFWHTYSSVMYSLYEIEIPKHLPPPPDKATQADKIENPKELLPVLQLKTGQYPDGMSCVSLGSKLYFFGGEFNMDNPYIDEDVKKNFKDSERDVFPRQLLILDLSEVGASGDELHKLLVDGEQMRSGKARPHAFVAEEKIYVIGSTIESSISRRSKLTRLKLESFICFEVYDPEVGQWHDLPDPPIGNVKTRWVGHAIVRRQALLVAWQGGKERLYCFDLGESRWTDASIPFYPEIFSGRTEFVEDTLYGCYHNTIAAIATVEETKIEKEEKKEKVEAEEGEKMEEKKVETEEGEKMEAEKVKAKETVEAEEGQGWLLKNLRLHVLSEEMGMDAIFNVPPQLQSSSSLLHLGNRYFCYVISGMPPNSDNDSDDVIKDDKKRFISIVIFQALGKKYEKDVTGLLLAQFLYSAHYEINSPVPNEGFINGCFFPGSLKEMAERLPVGAARNSNSPSRGSSSPPITQDVSTAATDMLYDCVTFLELDSEVASSLGISDWSSTISDYTSSDYTSSDSEVLPPEATAMSKTRTAKGEPTNGLEWNEKYEPGVYINLVSLPGGAREIKRVRFSRKLFSEKEAEQWWTLNKARVYQQYNILMVDKASVGMGREGSRCK